MLSQRRTGTIGILTPQSLPVMFSNPFFATFAEGVALATEQSGFGLRFISPLNGSLTDAMGLAVVDGLVAIGLSGMHPEFDEVRRSGVPTVLVDSGAMDGFPSLELDDHAGALAAAEHLLALGHTRFLVIGVEPPHPAWGDDPEVVLHRRLDGYRSAIQAAGLELPDEAVVVGPAGIQGGYAAFERAWQDGLRPTAVLAMSDAMAVGAIQAIHEQRLHVPDDVSVVGFDDLEIARVVNPPLTTVHQPVRRRGEEAAQLLLDAIAHGDAPAAHRIYQTRLIVRASTGPARRSEGGEPEAHPR
jgi:DNA-binding LacI/PurR family transcriptional regulator